MAKCSIDGCEGDRYCRGWCSVHYSRWRTHGDPLYMSKPRPMAPRFIEEDRGFDTSCFITTSRRDAYGYGRTKDIHGRRRKAHHVAWEWVHGPIPAKYELHHRCEQRDCVRLDHLRALTRREHMALDGRAAEAGARGRSQAKLSDSQVRELRERLCAGEMTQTTAAEQYGVSKQLVNDIARGRVRRRCGGPLGSALDGRKVRC